MPGFQSWKDRSGGARSHGVVVCLPDAGWHEAADEAVDWCKVGVYLAVLLLPWALLGLLAAALATAFAS